MDIPYASQEDGTTSASGRQGKTFLKVCDMRTATIVMSSINIVLILIGAIISCVRFFGFTPLLAAIPPLALSCIAIFGAVNFEFWLVALAAVGFSISLIHDLWWLDILGIIMGLLIVYPTVTLAYELRTGVMSKATQSREAFIDYDTAERAGVKKEYINTFNEKVSETFTYNGL